MNILEMSAMGAVLIVFTLLLRKFLGQRLMPCCYLMLWALAGARLLFPVKIASPWSVYNLFCSSGEAGGMLAVTARNVNHAAAWAAMPITTTGETGSISWTLLLWLGGALLCFLYMVSSHWQCRRWYAASLPVEQECVKRWQDTHPLRRAYQIQQSQMVQTPLTYGFFRPVILLPDEPCMSNEQMRMVLLHEWNHIRHMDVLWQWLLVLICSLHWFNPAVWLMYRFCRQDLELWCDAAVVNQLKTGENRGYAMLLLEQASRNRRPVPVFSPSRFTGYQSMEERIQMIMKPKTLGWKAAAVTVLLLCAGGTAFATTAQSDVNSAETWIDVSSAPLVWPVASEERQVTLEYGVREHPVTGELFTNEHISIGGADIKGSPVLAADDGIVKETGYHPQNGNYVLIAHDEDRETRYWHCENLLVESGEAVKAGQKIGTVGQTGDATGPCLSFAVYENGEDVDPMPLLVPAEE